MDYLDLFRRRSSIDGTTEQERMTSKLSKDFLQLIHRSPNKEKITIGTQTYEVIIQSGNSRVGTQTEKKVIQYLLAPRDFLFPEGTKFYTTDVDGTHAWLILHREVHSSYGYFKYKIIELNYKIKYINAQGVLKVLETFVNGTYEFDIKDYFAFSKTMVMDKPNRALNLIYPSTLDVDENCRFYIGRETWRFVDADDISIPGVSYATISQTPTDEQQTNKQDNITDMNKLNNSTIISSFGELEDIELSLEMRNCEFFMKTNKKLVPTVFEYEISNPKVLAVENGKIIPLDFGRSKIAVKTDIGLVKVFNVNIARSTPLYFNLLGDNAVKINYSQTFKIITNYDDLTFRLSDESYGTLKVENDCLLFSAKDQIGEIKILCYSNNNVIAEVPITITSLYI